MTTPPRDLVEEAVSFWKTQARMMARAADTEKAEATAWRKRAEAAESELRRLREAQTEAKMPPDCAQCLHSFESHCNAACVQGCHDVVADGSRCGCSRYVESLPSGPDA